MTDDIELDPTYVAARRVLLDALQGLAPHGKAVIVVGAQAIYLRTGINDIAIAPYTSDGDLALDPTLLGDDPALEQSMRDSGLQLLQADGRDRPGAWGTYERVNGEDVLIPIDLMVPDAIAPAGGSRSAHLPMHGNRAARKAVGLEAALVDHGAITIAALDPGDPRRLTVEVAGLAAMVVAKAHKIHDRVESGRVNRVNDKDAADMYRIMQIARLSDLRATFAVLANDPVAGPVTTQALDYVVELFGSRSGEGITMAHRALQGAMDPVQVTTLSQSFARSIQPGIE